MDIGALARAGVNKVWPLIASELTASTVKCGPVGDYDPDEDTTDVTWTHEIALDALIYGRELEQKDGTTQEDLNTPERKFVAKALIRFSDMNGVVPDDQSQLVAGSDTWRVTNAEYPPGSAIYILSLRK